MDSSTDSGTARVVYLLMAGGSGKRLWPASRHLYPKPLFRLLENRSLIGETIKLMSSHSVSPEITVLLGASHEKAFRSHISGMDTGSVRVNFAPEPLSRNTAPAIALGVMRTLREFEEDDGDAVFIVSPADHVIGDKDNFFSAINTAIDAAETGRIVTIGVKPTRPETGYGYIQKGAKTDVDGSFNIKKFTEKPDLATAEKYLKNSYLWNCGIFVFKGRVMLEEIKKHAPKVFSAVRKSLSREDCSAVPDADSYARSPDISIDFAVMEKTALGAVVPASFEWSDIGSWEAVYNLVKKKNKNNVTSGDVILEDSENCLVRGGDRLIVGNGLKDLVIVDEGDALLVSDIRRSEEIKTVVDGLIRRKRPEAVRPARTEHRWGFEELIEKGRSFSIKTARIFEKMEYEPQTLSGRVVVLEGDAIAVFAENSVSLSAGDLLEIPDDIPLRIKNSGKSQLRLLEISFEPEE